MTGPVRVPVDLGRDEARQLARLELADPAYDDDRSLLQRAVQWVIDRITEIIERSAGALDDAQGIAILTAIALGIVLLLAWRFGPLARVAARKEPLFGGDGPRSAGDYWTLADAAASRGEWSAAVVERFRAVVAGLEERAILEPQPGRTADEAAAAAATALPSLAGDLTTAALLFDGVRYGGRPATADDDAALRRLAESARSARIHVAETAGTLVAPR